MQLSPQTIRRLSRERGLIDPFQEGYKHASGLSGGLSCAGYDVHIAAIKLPMLDGNPLFHNCIAHTSKEDVWDIFPGEGILGVTYESFCLPDNICMNYVNKSSLARQFILSPYTIGEPGWHGHLTLEIKNQSDVICSIQRGQPIGQVTFQLLDESSDNPYTGKYQGQKCEPIQAILEKDEN